MIAGKVPPDLLRRLVYPHLPHRPDILVDAGIGEDSAVIDFGPFVCVATCDPITGAAAHLGRLAVHVACNDIAATGAEPIALLLTLLLHEGATEEDLEEIMREAAATAVGLNVAIVGGHTEVTSRVSVPLAVVAAIGRADRGAYLRTGGARPGDTLLLTKAAGLEGTAILATDLAGRLRDAGIGEDVLDRARGFVEAVSVLPEGRVAARSGASGMHDVTEGGVLAAVWEMAEAAGTGVELWSERIPVRPETEAICRSVGADPLALIGSGAMLIATPDPHRVERALREARIAVARIGRMQDGPRIVHRGGASRELVPPARDELWRVLDRHGTM